FAHTSFQNGKIETIGVIVTARGWFPVRGSVFNLPAPPIRQHYLPGVLRRSDPVAVQQDSMLHTYAGACYHQPAWRRMCRMGYTLPRHRPHSVRPYTYRADSDTPTSICHA